MIVRHWPVDCHMHTRHVRVFFGFSSKGGGEGRIRLYRLLGGKSVSVCKMCGKLGRFGSMLPREILILELLLDAIWWDVGLFLGEHNLDREKVISYQLEFGKITLHNIICNLLSLKPL